MTTFIKNIIISLRPKQWIKNCFVLAALVFGREFNDASKVLLAFAAFALFCCASSAVYLLNDIVDLPSDRNHPVKKNRPLAAGKISVAVAIVMAFLLASLVITLGFKLNSNFGITIFAYIVLNLLYSWWLKKVVIIDVIAIALGFVLRVVSGAFVVQTLVSPWLILCTFFLTLFLGISKRKSELVLSDNHSARSVLNEYSLPFIDQMNMIVLPLTLISYTFYTFSSEHSKLLMATVPIVLYGLLRYLFILNKKQTHNDGPTDDFFSDRQLQCTVAVWVVVILLILIYQQ